MMSSTGRVLSIQSHVVYGYVGNSCATLPLQLLGFDVCNINSVQFSNHKGYASVALDSEPFTSVTDSLTGYEHCTGKAFTAHDVHDLYDGLKLNGLTDFSYVLTGYVGDPSFLEKVCDIIEDIKKTNPSITFVCDPVIGDNGHMYVPRELLPIYRNRLVYLADIIIPNQFEAELLTGIKINSLENALDAMECLHRFGAKTVVISSSDLGDDDSLLSLASSVQDGSKVIYRILVPKINGLFVGTGDLLAALLLAWLEKDKDLKVALEKSMSTMQRVIKRTQQSSLASVIDGSKPSAAQMELRLVQSKFDIENPHPYLMAELIDTSI